MRYAFACSDLDALSESMDRNGFAVACDVLDAAEIAMLSDDVRKTLDPNGDVTLAGGNRYCTDYAERSPGLLTLLEHERWRRVYDHLLGTSDLVIHRSAAIVRAPGDGGMGWHTDRGEWTGVFDANSALNRLDIPNGMWFYLTGCRPSHGGLAVIAGSHKLDYRAPAGYTLSEDRARFHPAGQPDEPLPMEVPGAVGIECGPGDLLMFADRTFHAARPNREQIVRLSCAMIMRPDQPEFTVPWGATPSARAFAAGLPPRLQRYARGYTGIDHAWRPEPTAVAAG
ncbi:MAG: phytanoyl-CoA dioxygenase family protein [Planctomycetes bacterium]|nr:phytanoyl-CoA dioxygenase family protein [Planctomycetota bacterium]